jgi:hypothetical protein
MAHFWAQIVAGGIVGLVAVVIFAVRSDYEFFATAVLMVLGIELFTGRWLMLVATVISACAAVMAGRASSVGALFHLQKSKSKEKAEQASLL